MLPILDISEYLDDPQGTLAQDFVTQLIETCHNTGFFYLTGHGIDSQFDADNLSIANNFFDLPDEQREAIAIGKSPHFRGYTLLKHERTAGHVDWRDQIDIGHKEP